MILYHCCQTYKPPAFFNLMKVTASTVAPLPSTIIKMEDRKRPAGQNVDDLAPPTKRQAVNGGSKSSTDSDMPGKDDLEVSVTRPPENFFTLFNSTPSIPE
jgi:E3 ubiquitin-protein ligase BRE1